MSSLSLFVLFLANFIVAIHAQQCGKVSQCLSSGGICLLINGTTCPSCYYENTVDCPYCMEPTMVDGKMTCPASGPRGTSFMEQCEVSTLTTPTNGVTTEVVGATEAAAGGSAILFALIGVAAIGAVAVGAVLYSKKKTQRGVTLGEARASTVMQPEPCYTSDSYSYEFSQDQKMAEQEYMTTQL